MRVSPRIDSAARGLAGFGVLLLIAASTVAVSDIVGRHALGVSVLGVVDLTQLLIMSGVFLSLPYVFSSNGHVSVDLLISRVSKKQQRQATRVFMLISAVVMAGLTITAFFQAKDQFLNSSVSQTLNLPMIVYWVPLLVGCGFSSVVCLVKTFHPPDQSLEVSA